MENFNYEIICPVCGEYHLKDEFDICKICFWENDLFQLKNANESGANHLSLNDYRKWWQILEKKLPPLIDRFKIKQSKNALWKYDKLCVLKQFLNDFKTQLSNYNIEFEQDKNVISIVSNPRQVPYLGNFKIEKK